MQFTDSKIYRCFNHCRGIGAVALTLAFFVYADVAPNNPPAPK